MDILRKGVAHWDEDGELDTCVGELDAQLEIATDFCNAFGGTLAESVDNPRERIAATVAACYTMILSGMLTSAGHFPTRLDTRGEVDLCVKGKPKLSRVLLKLTAAVPGITSATFDRLANDASDMIARSLKAPPIILESTLSA